MGVAFEPWSSWSLLFRIYSTHITIVAFFFSFCCCCYCCCFCCRWRLWWWWCCWWWWWWWWWWRCCGVTAGMYWLLISDRRVGSCNLETHNLTWQWAVSYWISSTPAKKTVDYYFLVSKLDFQKVIHLILPGLVRASWKMCPAASWCAWRGLSVVALNFVQSLAAEDCECQRYLSRESWWRIGV